MRCGRRQRTHRRRLARRPRPRPAVDAAGTSLGATGAGDVKLFAAIGTLLGPVPMRTAFLYTAIAGGALALLSRPGAGGCTTPSRAPPARRRRGPPRGGRSNTRRQTTGLPTRRPLRSGRYSRHSDCEENHDEPARLRLERRTRRGAARNGAHAAAAAAGRRSGIFEFGRAYQTWQVLTNAAREGARVAVLPNAAAGAAERARRGVPASRAALERRQRQPSR